MLRYLNLAFKSEMGSNKLQLLYLLLSLCPFFRYLYSTWGSVFQLFTFTPNIWTLYFLLLAFLKSPRMSTRVKDVRTQTMKVKHGENRLQSDRDTRQNYQHGWKWTKWTLEHTVMEQIRRSKKFPVHNPIKENSLKLPAPAMIHGKRHKFLLLKNFPFNVRKHIHVKGVFSIIIN